MNIFIFYPSVYVRDNGTKCIVFDTDNGNYIIINSLGLNKKYIPTWLEVNSSTRKIIGEKLDHRYGYILGCNKMPYIPDKKIHIISSIDKTSCLTRFNEGYHTKELVRNIHILTHNTSYIAPHENIYGQIKYPYYNVDGIYAEDFITEVAQSYADTITISGDIDDYLQNIIIPSFHATNKQLLVRTFYRKDCTQKIQTLLNYNPSMKFEIIVDLPKSYIEIKKNIHNDDWKRITIKPIIAHPSEVQNYISNNFCHVKFIPILFDMEKQSEMLGELLLDENDIASNQSLQNILKRTIFHVEYNGSVYIDLSGKVFCGIQHIGNLCEGNLYKLINTWLHSPNCAWKMTRRNMALCNNCIFTDLCPSITIYEQQGYLSFACKPKVREIFANAKL